MNTIEAIEYELQKREAISTVKSTRNKQSTRFDLKGDEVSVRYDNISFLDIEISHDEIDQILKNSVFYTFNGTLISAKLLIKNQNLELFLKILSSKYE